MRGVTWRQRSEWVKRGGALWALQSLCFTSLSKKEERARTCIHAAGVSIEQNAWNWVKCETEMNKHVIHKCAACNHSANVWILRWAGLCMTQYRMKHQLWSRAGNTSHVEQGCACSMSRYTHKHTQTSTRLNLTVSADCRLSTKTVTVNSGRRPSLTLPSFAITTPLRLANR